MSGWTPGVAGSLVLVVVVLLILVYALWREEEDDWPKQLLRDAQRGVSVRENHGTKVVVSQAYFWEPIDTAPLGCKVQLKTIPGGIATYGEVTERNRKHFSDWAPLPTTRKDKK